MSPALNGSSTLERFERSNTSEIRNAIMFDFYPGLPHMYFLCVETVSLHNVQDSLHQTEFLDYCLNVVYINWIHVCTTIYTESINKIVYPQLCLR